MHTMKGEGSGADCKEKQRDVLREACDVKQLASLKICQSEFPSKHNYDYVSDMSLSYLHGSLLKQAI